MTARVYVNLLEGKLVINVDHPQVAPAQNRKTMADGIRCHWISKQIMSETLFALDRNELILIDSCIYMYFIVWFGETLTHIKHNSKLLYLFVGLFVPRALHQLVLLVDHAAPSASSWMPWTSLRILGTKSEWMSLGLDQGSRGTSFWAWLRFLELGSLLQVHRV